MTSLNVSKPVALFVVFEDENGDKHEAHIPTAQITEVRMDIGTTYWEFASRREWSITKFNKHVRRKHIKENA